MINQTLLLAGDDAYNLTKSLRFRSSASATLSRTPASASNRKTWTLSAWVKKSEVSASGQIFVANYSSVPWFVFGFENDNTLTISATAGSSASWKSTALFRDPSAWYHVMCVVDTTSATSTMSGSSTDRLRMYVNGTQYVMSGGTVPTQNSDLQVNNNVAHSICGYSTEYFGGYLGEVNFIDGQALTPSSFGETDVLTGVWKPKKYAGTYGTNGFYLPFTDVATTSGSNAGLGKDFSGNGNYWTTNNISVTAGTTYDSMTDVPTLTSATTANYCVLNPLFNNQTGISSANTGTVTITNGNLTAATTSGSIAGAVGTLGVSSGKWYFEYTITTASVSGDVAGFITSFSGAVTSWIGYRTTGSIYSNGTTTSGYATSTAGDIIGIALDIGGSTVSCYKNNTLLATTTLTNAITADCFPLIWFRNDTGSGSVNFGQQPFTYTPPTGFVALNTFNLPEPSIKQGNKYMDATTYSGNGTSQTITNASGFAPDFVWIKGRNYADNHTLWNTVVGAQKSLSSDTTTAETTRANALTAFASNGFTLGTDTIVNYSAGTYVGWQWKANGTGSSNTAGSITSTVSANPTAGFSVVTYTGDGNLGSTVGHGLGVAPKMVIVKNRNNGGAGWYVYHASVGNTGALFLNQTSAVASTSSYWNNTTPTSSVFTIGDSGGVNQSTYPHVAYCFAEVAGYSKFGSYTGNGSATDGTYIHLGFKPKFIMFKRSDSTSNWMLFDGARDLSNITDSYLYPNLSQTEGTSSSLGVDFLSNGVKIRADYSDCNASGGTYVFAAFAETPFKYSLAR